ncbi:Type VI secretion system-associated protein [Salmonella enterica subsp. enterica]|uniref:Type VI secretion system-associated protein n=1 Tax=Salmonella enterica I TaxID=59201 RepID=A0A379WZ48_SALET|nr:Type VI secretion system-associated protein [Salmonella enterica subsp. enterica]
MNRPSFNEAWLAFRKVNHSVADVGSIIGETLGKI